jgi:hypothetical protein
MDGMTFLVFIAAALAVLSLYQGVVAMAHGGDWDQLHSHELMLKRTGWQALAVGFILAALLAGH